MNIYHAERFFAKYVDHVPDTTDISGTSRFVAGGLGGISSQLGERSVLCIGRVHLNLRLLQPSTLSVWAVCTLLAKLT
jgi:hypothetical protein